MLVLIRRWWLRLGDDGSELGGGVEEEGRKKTRKKGERFKREYNEG